MILCSRSRKAASPSSAKISLIGRPALFLDDEVAVDERDAERPGEDAAHGGLARAHEADKDDHRISPVTGVSSAMARSART